MQPQTDFVGTNQPMVAARVFIFLQANQSEESEVMKDMKYHCTVDKSLIKTMACSVRFNLYMVISFIMRKTFSFIPIDWLCRLIKFKLFW